METEIREFLKQYPEYDNDDYYVRSDESHRYGGDYEITVYVMDRESGPDYLCTYWCKLLNNTYQFELEKEVNVMRVEVYIGQIGDKLVHYDCDEQDHTKIEKDVLKKFKKENDRKIREEIARKILSGELAVTYSISDTDSWDAPLSQVDVYKV